MRQRSTGIAVAFLVVAFFAPAGSEAGRGISVAPPNPSPDCQKVHNELGQLFYQRVMGYSNDDVPGTGIEKPYVELVRDLGIGGVLPFVDSNDPQKIVASSRALQQAAEQGPSHLPAILGVDFDTLSAGGNKTQFGLGYGPGLIGNLAGKISGSCFKNLVVIDAYLHKAMGLNQSLGPTIEQNPRENFLMNDASTTLPFGEDVYNTFHQMGVAVTEKHFPYTPSSYNLHDKSEDTHLSEEEVLSRLKAFKESGQTPDFLMTTHLINSNIDPKDMVTFSEKWMKILRNDIGYKGIVMTDGLFMIDHYGASVISMASNWEGPKFQNTKSIFAARAILAGHDMVFLEGDGAQTREVFRDLQGLACSDSKMGLQLRKRVFESFDRIRAYKEKHKKALTQTAPMDPQMISEAVGLYKKVEFGQGCDSPEEKGFEQKVAKLGLIPSAPPSKVEDLPCVPQQGAPGAPPMLSEVDKVLNAINGSQDPKAEILKLLQPPIQQENLKRVCEVDEWIRDNVSLTVADIDPSLYTTQAGIEALGCLHTSDPTVVAKVAENFKSPSLAMRHATVDALWGLGGATADDQTELRKYLKDPDPTIRYDAIEALGKSVSKTPETVNALLALMKSPSEVTQQAAIEALALKKDETDPKNPGKNDLIVDSIMKALPSFSPDLKEEAVADLSLTQMDNPKVFRYAISEMNDPNFGQSIGAVYMVSNYLNGAGDGVPAERKSQISDQFYALYQRIPVENQEIVQPLEAGFLSLHSEDPKIQVAEVNLMSKMNDVGSISMVLSEFASRSIAPAAIEKLQAVMKSDPSVESRAEAALILYKSRKDDPGVQKAIQEALVPGAFDDLDQSLFIDQNLKTVAAQDPRVQMELIPVLQNPATANVVASFFQYTRPTDPTVIAALKAVRPDLVPLVLYNPPAPVNQ